LSAFPVQPVKLCYVQGFPVGAQLQGSTQAGKGFLASGQMVVFLGIETLHGGRDCRLVIFEATAAYQLI